MKRFRLVIFNENYSNSNYDDKIYFNTSNDTFDKTLVILQDDDFENILKVWDMLLPMYQGMTYCIRDMYRLGKTYVRDYNGTPFTHSTLLVGGVFDPYDIDFLTDYNPDTFEFESNYF